MIKLFKMLVERLAKIFDFFNKYQVSENARTAFMASRFFGRKAMLAVLIALTLTYFALIIAFVYFTFDAVTTAYNLISSLLNQVQTGTNTNSEILKTFYYLLNVSGISTGIQAVFPFIASALTFRLMKPIKSVFITLHRAYLYSATDLIKIVTAA